MKLLLILSFIAVSAIGGTSQRNLPGSQDLDMQLSAEIEFQEKVKIYDYDGELLSEYLLEDVVNNDITLSDHFTLEESDYAFNYLGDYYYFSEELTPLGAN